MVWRRVLELSKFSVLAVDQNERLSLLSEPFFALLIVDNANFRTCAPFGIRKAEVMLSQNLEVSIYQLRTLRG